MGTMEIIKKTMSMKTIKLSYKIMRYVALFAIVFATSCSDISKTQEEYTSRGETNYVGKLDSVVVNGGNTRVIIEGKNTYMRNATECLVWWVAPSGEIVERVFDITQYANSEKTTVVVDNLAEGNYQFNVVTKDAQGNKSLPVECYGSVYGPIYAKTQLGAIVTNITRNEDGSAVLSLSDVDDVTKLVISYINVDGVTQSVELDYAPVVTIPSWRGSTEEEISITTHVIPEDMAGVDVIALETKSFDITRGMALLDVDKSKMSIKTLTKNDDKGYDIGDNSTGEGARALIDGNEGSQMRSGTVPGHIGIDMGANYYLNEISIVGRHDYFGWDLVKLEIWGRETIDEDGKTHEIEATSLDPNFETEAVQKGWVKVGKAWFTYQKGSRPTPTRPTVALTETDYSIKPRYILFRVMSVLTPDDFGGRDNYDGTDGGYWMNDGHQLPHRRSAQIGEAYFKAQQYSYNIN